MHSIIFTFNKSGEDIEMEVIEFQCHSACKEKFSDGRVPSLFMYLRGH